MSKSVKSKKKKNPFVLFIFVLLFLIGASVLAFPFVSQYLYYQASQVEVNYFEKEAEKLTDEEIERRIYLANAFNAGLYYGKSEGLTQVEDPYSQEEIAAGRKEYASMLEIHEQIGNLSIPKISEELPVFAGTSETVLQKGVGHLEGSSLPVGGNNTHAVLTAHRGLPNARLFTDLDKLAEGDYFYYKNVKETIAYQVDKISVIEPTEVDQLKIEPGHDYMTLLTCTPYMINSHRLLVRGHRVPYDQAIAEKQVQEHRINNRYRILFYMTLGILTIVLLLNLLGFLSRRKRNKLN